MSYNLFYILLLVAFDSFSAIPPTNSEFWMMKYIYNNNSGKWYVSFGYYLLLYVTFCMFGGLIGYFIGYFAQDTIIIILNFLFDLIFGSKIIGSSTFSNLLNSYDPIKILLLKSFTPGIPVSLFNLACGIKGSNILSFIFVTFVFRTMRFVFIFSLKRYLKYPLIVNLLQIITLIYIASATILLIYCTYSINVSNILFTIK